MCVALQYFYLYHFFENPVAQKNTPIFFPNIWEKKFEFAYRKLPNNPPTALMLGSRPPKSLLCASPL